MIVKNIKYFIHKTYFHHIIEYCLTNTLSKNSPPQPLPTDINYTIKHIKTLLSFLFRHTFLIQYKYHYKSAINYKNHSSRKDDHPFIKEELELSLIDWLTKRNIDYSYKMPINIEFQNLATNHGFKINSTESILTFFGCCNSKKIVQFVLDNHLFSQQDINESIHCIEKQNNDSEEIISTLLKKLFLLDGQHLEKTIIKKIIKL